MELCSPVSNVSLHWWPNVIRSLTSMPFSGHFTRLRADDVKSWRLHRPTVVASLGFSPTMWKADVITHHMPSWAPFCSKQILLLLATQWLVSSPGQVAGEEPCGCSGSTVCSLPRGAAVVSQGNTNTYNGIGFFLNCTYCLTGFEGKKIIFRFWK